MIITEVEISNVRGYEQASFSFQPGMNLIVGVNGVGKSTILDVLRIQLSKVMPELTASRSQKLGFSVDDIRLGRSTLNCRLEFMVADRSFRFITVKQRKEITESVEDENKMVDTPDVNRLSPAIAEVFPNADESEEQPLVLYFSTRRSLTTETKPIAVAGQALAFNEALSPNRAFNIREIADWMIVQFALVEEDNFAHARLQAVLITAKELLPKYGNLHVNTSKGVNTLKIEKDEDLIPVKWLSDGERSLLSLALDLARRLAFANPGLKNPVKDGQAIVLIDELDLHLHPRWQRLVVKQLTSTFPNCQFICTTHSPQLIGEVPAERVTIIGEGTVYHPEHTFGVDSSRILEEVMDTTERNVKVDKTLKVLFEQIDDEELAAAKKSLAQLIELVGERDGEVLRAQTMITFLED